MTRKRYYIVLLLMMLITLTASATAYDATSVKMCTSAGDISMVRIGMTADSCGIWVCRNVGEDVKNVRWKMDDAVYITYPAKKFDTDTLYQLGYYTDFTSDQTITGDTTVYVYLKVKDQKHAQCFLWNGDTLPTFASDFHITGSATADVTEGYYGENCYIHMLKYQVSGMSEDAFDHYSIERSYDDGTTWTTVNGYATIMNATLPIMLSLDEKTVRYRITAHLKDGYQAAWNDSTWTYETSTYKISPIYRLRYEASNVKGKAGEDGGWSFNYSLLGISKDGYQVWGCQGADCSSKYRWWIDDGTSSLSINISDYRPYTIYSDIDDDYYDRWDRTAPTGTQWYHFVRVHSNKSLDYFSCNPTEEKCKQFHPYSFYLYADFFFGGRDITVNRSTHTLQQEITYGVKYIDGKMLDSIAVYASCDQGKTWKQISAITTRLEEGVNNYTKNEIVDIPGNGTTIRYRVVAHPKDAYKVLADGGRWVYETADSPLTFSEAFSASSITVNPIDKEQFANTEGTPRGTYRAEIAYHMLSKVANQVDSVQIQCSNDHGKTWTTLETTNCCEGELTERVPAGYASYLFRAVPFLKGDLANVPLLSQPVTSTEQTISYSPEVTSLTAEKTATEESCGKTLYTYTVRYVLNTDLYRTRREASIAYSYDDGQHWYDLQPFVPNLGGEQTVLIDMDENQRQCRFRIDVGSTAYDKETIYSKETQNITFE